MTPRKVLKATPKVQRCVTMSIASKGRSSPATVTKKSLNNKKIIEKTPLKMTNSTPGTRMRTNTVPITTTPKPKENKLVPLPCKVTKSAKKSAQKRRPQPAHSGVPVPEKMKQLVLKQFDSLDDII